MCSDGHNVTKLHEYRNFIDLDTAKAYFKAKTKKHGLANKGRRFKRISALYIFKSSKESEEK